MKNIWLFLVSVFAFFLLMNGLSISGTMISSHSNIAVYSGFALLVTTVGVFVLLVWYIVKKIIM